MSKPVIGFLLGKFYPPHAGHHYLIREAKKNCDQLYVLVMWSEKESITGRQRVKWLEEIHGGSDDVFILDVQDEIPDDYEDPRVWEQHINLVYSVLPVPPDVVFSSEEYGEELARRMHARHHQVDINRRWYQVSGTKVREDPPKYWNFLTPEVARDLCKRVVVCGAESTGTTTLAQDLAEFYGTTWVPEYGRTFSEGVGENYKWDEEDFFHIAQTQQMMIDFYARKAGPLLIADTDAWATHLFHKLYLGKESDLVADYASCFEPDLYIITDHVGVPFEQDGLRKPEENREWMTRQFEGLLPHVKVTGSRLTRLRLAQEAIDGILKWEFTPPLS